MSEESISSVEAPATVIGTMAEETFASTNTTAREEQLIPNVQQQEINTQHQQRPNESDAASPTITLQQQPTTIEQPVVVKEEQEAVVEEPKPEVKKRLTLQERLAMAAKRKASKTEPKQSSLSPTGSSPRESLDIQTTSDLSSTTSTAVDNKQRDATDGKTDPETEEFVLPENYKELSKEELLNLLDTSANVQKRLKTVSTNKINELSKQVNNLQKDLQEQTKKQIQAAKRVVTPAGNDALRKKLEDKEIQIKELLEEGSKLSMKEVNLTQTTKKMKQKEIELEDELTKSEKEIENLHNRTIDLEAEIESLKESERSVKEERHGHESLQNKYDALLVERDTIYNELKELKFRKLDVQLTNTKKMLDDETNISNDLQSKLDKLSNQFKLYKEDSRNQISQLEYKLDREKNKYLESMEESSNEIKRLENKVESLRMQSESAVDKGIEVPGLNSQTSSTISIDLLQAQYTVAEENWKLIESTYQKKISNLESDIEILKQKDLSYSKKVKTLTNDIKLKSSEINELMDTETTLRSELEDCKNMINRLKQDLETQKHGRQVLESDYENEKASLEKRIQSLEEEKTSLTNINKLKIDTQSATSLKTSGSSDTTNSAANANSFYLNDVTSSPSIHPSRTQRSVSTVSMDGLIGLGESSSTPRLSQASIKRGLSSSSSLYFQSPMQSYANGNIPLHMLQPGERQVPQSLEPIDDSINSSSEEIYQNTISSLNYGVHNNQSNNILNRSYSRDEFDTAHSSTIGGAASNSITGGANIQVMGKLSSHIRRLEIEVMTLKDEVGELNAQKQEASNEIIRLLKENEMVEGYKSKMTALEEDFSALNSNYETTLQLLGEKSEKCGELEADVDDLKDLMRQQVQQMVDMQEAMMKQQSL